MANKNEKLVLKHKPAVIAQEGDKLTLALNVDGMSDAKPGKETHVVAYGTQQVVRSDGKIVTVQVTAWYK